MSDSERSVYSNNESDLEEGRGEGGSKSKNHSGRIVSRSRSYSDDDGSRKKRRKMEKKFDFIIREAEVDDEPEDDEELEEEIAQEIGIVRNEIDEIGLTAREIDGRRRGTNLWDSRKIDEIEEYLRNKYDHESAAAHRFSNGGGEINDDITQKKLLPDVKDPKLWMIKCRIGEEKATALLMMRKFLTYEFTSLQLEIKSVLAPEGIKGYIYIEAYKQAHVEAAIQNVGNLQMGVWKQQMVPVKEMADVLRVVKKQTGLKLKQWVRPKRGTYKDDIAQVHYVDLAQNQVHLKLLPRIDYTNYTPKGALRPAQSEPEVIKRKKKNRIPPAKPFNPAAIHTIGGKITRDGDFYIFEGNRYCRRGFLYKKYIPSAIIADGVKPTLSELKKFEEAPEDIDIELSGALMTGVSADKKGQTVTPTFSTGDNVVVCEGELMNLRGKVVSLDGNIVTMIPKHEILKEATEFQASELRKYFTIGDHVKVVAGQHEGETGLIVRVKQNHVFLFTDVSMRELEVMPHHLQLHSGMAAGVNSLDQFQWGDLVQLDPQTTGVIVRLERDNFHVLSMYGKVVEVRPQTLSKRHVNPNMCALDSQGNCIKRKDIVEVVDGPPLVRGCEIKYLFRCFAFLYSRKLIDNDGIFVCKTRHLKLTGGSKANTAAAPTPIKGLVSPCIAPPMYPHGRGGGGGGGNRGGGRGTGAHCHPELVGTTIKITTGAYKGHVGIVREATEEIVRIELHSICQTIFVARSHIANVGVPTKNGGLSNYGRTPAHGTGSQTPMYGSQTPMYEPGSRTPHNGSMTPLHDAGSRTPGQCGAWDPTVRNTPAHTRDFND